MRRFTWAVLAVCLALCSCGRPAPRASSPASLPAIAPSQAAIAQARREIRELKRDLAAVKAQRDAANSQWRVALSAQRQLQARLDALAQAPRPSTTALPENPQTFDALSTVHGETQP
jgi:hypothetical protein